MKIKLKFEKPEDHELFEIHQIFKVLRVSRGQDGPGWVEIIILGGREDE